MITQESMMHDANAAVDIYSKLEQDIYARIIQTLKTTNFDTVDSQNVLRWQVEQLSKMGVLNKQVVDLVAKYAGQSKQSIEQLVHDNGLQIVDEVDATLSQQLHKKVAVDDDIKDTLSSIQNQTWRDLDNTVNQSLLSTNYGENGAMRAYQNIIKQTTMETTVGLKTYEKAFKDAVYRMVDGGIKSKLVDKGGHNWSIEGYARTVIQTTAHRTFNNLRLKRMQDYGTTLAVMSSHPAAREACAPIQGQVVNLTEPGSDTYNAKYDSIYNHGYGTPAGTQGINCSHTLYPFIEGVNTNNQPQYDPEEAKANGDIQAKQRGYERAIRQTKKKLAAAEELGDKEGVARYKSLLGNQRANIRSLVKEHDFLHRDYSREKIFTARPQSMGERVKPVKSESARSSSFDKLQRTNISQVLKPSEMQEYVNNIDKSPKILRDQYLKHSGDIHFAKGTSRAYVDFHGIHISQKDVGGTKGNKRMQTIFHETAHYFDSKPKRIDALAPSANVGLKEALSKDYWNYFTVDGEPLTNENFKKIKRPRKNSKNYDQKMIEYRKKTDDFYRKYDDYKKRLKDQLESWNKLDSNVISDLSDMLEATGQVGEYPLGFGHGTSYWLDHTGKTASGNKYHLVNHNQEAEFFAEVSSELAVNPEAFDLGQQIFPTAYKLYEKIAKKIVERKDLKFQK